MIDCPEDAVAPPGQDGFEHSCAISVTFHTRIADIPIGRLGGIRPVGAPSPAWRGSALEWKLVSSRFSPQTPPTTP